MDSNGHPVLFFDGECNLCNGVVQFIIRHDKHKRFRFAQLQSEAGKRAQAIISDKEVPGSVVLLFQGQYFTKSAAALHVLRLLGGGWKLCYSGIVFPRYFRDWIYDIIARNRYKWFGKRDECMVPTPELKERFLA